MKRANREKALRAQNRQLKAALSAIHDALHADDANRAHELCECALSGGDVSQPNISAAAAAKGLTFAAEFNALAERHKVRACCVQLVPSVTVSGAVSIQLCGETVACKVVESMMRGEHSTYMGDHEKERAE